MSGPWILARLARRRCGGFPLIWKMLPTSGHAYGPGGSGSVLALEVYLKMIKETRDSSSMARNKVFISPKSFVVRFMVIVWVANG